MNNLWISFAFLTASIKATLALFDKIVLDKDYYGPLMMALVSSGSMFTIFIFVGLVSGSVPIGVFSSGPEDPLPVSIALVGGIFYLITVIAYFYGMEATDVSRFFPLLSTDIIFVVILAFVLLGEGFPWTVYLGILVIFAGSFLISVENISENVRFTSLKALLFGSGVVVSAALINIILKYLTSSMSMTVILFWIGLGGFISVIIYGFGYGLRYDFPSFAKLSGILLSLGGSMIIIRGWVIGTSYYTLTRAVETGPVSLVVAIGKMDVFLIFFGVVVLSNLTPEVLKEQMSWTVLTQKFIASALVVGGVIIIQAMIV